jgi:hypothetical protein
MLRRFWWFIPDWKQKVEGGARKVFLVLAPGFRPNRPAVGLKDAPGDCQSQACASTFEIALAARVEFGVSKTAEFFEDMVIVLRIDSDAAILNGYLDQPGQPLASDHYSTAIWRKFDRIAGVLGAWLHSLR